MTETEIESESKFTIPCPDCEKTFSNGAGLSSHRRSVHKYVDPEAKARWQHRKELMAARKARNTLDRAAKLRAEYKARVAARAKLKGDYVCDVKGCGRHFQAPTALGFHKRASHGIVGKYSLKHQKQQAKKHHVAKIHRNYAPVKKNGNAKGNFVCPECAKTFIFARALGKHRSAKHGILGSAKSTIQHRAKMQLLQGTALAKEAEPISLNCPDCGKGPFKNVSGLNIHRTTVHGKGATFNGNGTGNTNAEAVAFWIGQALRDCEAYAQRVELVPEEFISRLLAVVSRSSKEVRERYRLTN